MKYSLYKILLVSSCLLLISCGSTTFFSIDVMKPASYTFPEDVVNLVIVDNAGAKLDNTTKSPNQDISSSIISESKDVFMESLVQFMNEESYFGNVVLYPFAARTDINYGTDMRLTTTTIREIAQQSEADAVISIDNFGLEANEVMVNFEGFLFLAPQARMEILFRLYNAQGATIGPSMTTADSLSWYDNREGTRYNSEACNQLALQMSEGVVKQLIPHWEQQERWYYKGGSKLMKEGVKLADAKNWAEAEKKWSTAFDEANNNKQKAKIASNLAVANESMDNVDSAVVWIRKARELIDEYKQSDEYQQIIWYQITLLERQKRLPIVLEQIGASDSEEAYE